MVSKLPVLLSQFFPKNSWFLGVKSSIFSKRFARHALEGTANDHSVIFESAVP